MPAARDRVPFGAWRELISRVDEDSRLNKNDS